MVDLVTLGSRRCGNSIIKLRQFGTMNCMAAYVRTVFSLVDHQVETPCHILVQILFCR